MNFRGTVVRAEYVSGQNNIHFKVHPFRMPHIISMYQKGTYGHADRVVPDHLQPLADLLWDSIPGLKDLYFSNGKITIQHGGIFRGSDIAETALESIVPYLRDLAMEYESWG